MALLLLGIMFVASLVRNTVEQSYDTQHDFILSAELQKVFQRQLELAEKGDMEAQYSVGAIYLQEVVPGNRQENLEKGLRWLEKSAAQGHANAQYNLGMNYKKGSLVSHDTNEAVRWFRLAAEQGLYDAQFVLGHMYAQGEGVSQNNIEAYAWVALAASIEVRKEEELGIKKVEGAVTLKANLTKLLTHDQLIEAKKKENIYYKTFMRSVTKRNED